MKLPLKNLTASMVAAALLAPTLAVPAMAQADHRKPAAAASHDNHRKSAPAAQATRKQTYKTFRKGQKFDRRYARNYQVLDYRKYRNVKAPPRGYHYVRSGNDMLLVGITSGVVASVLTGMFR